MNFKVFFAFVLALSSASTIVRGSVLLSLDDRGVDLNTLSIGQTTTLDVVLSGLGPAESLGYLAGTVSFDNALLGSASNITPGDIVPDSAGFLGTGLLGGADGSYDFLFSLTSLPIDANGVFFSFDVTALTSGSGAVSLELSSLAARDLNDSIVEINSSSDLPFTITGVDAVPEPSSLVLLGGGLLSSMFFFRRRYSKKIAVE